MTDVREVFQLAAKHLANGLMTQADAQNRLLAGIGTDDIEQKPCLGRDARTWGEDDFAIFFQLRKLKLVIAQNGNLCAKLLDQVTQIIGKRVVVVDNHYFHKVSAFSMALLKAPSLLFTSCNS